MIKEIVLILLPFISQQFITCSHDLNQFNWLFGQEMSPGNNLMGHAYLPMPSLAMSPLPTNTSYPSQDWSFGISTDFPSMPRCQTAPQPGYK